MSPGGERMDHPDVRFPVLAGVLLTVDVHRGQPRREKYSPVSGNGIWTHDSHSATAPVMCIERGIAGPILAPSRVCTRSKSQYRNTE